MDDTFDTSIRWSQQSIQNPHEKGDSQSKQNPESTRPHRHLAITGAQSQPCVRLAGNIWIATGPTRRAHGIYTRARRHMRVENIRFTFTAAPSIRLGFNADKSQ